MSTLRLAGTADPPALSANSLVPTRQMLRDRLPIAGPSFGTRIAATEGHHRGPPRLGSADRRRDPRRPPAPERTGLRRRYDSPL